MQINQLLFPKLYAELLYNANHYQQHARAEVSVLKLEEVSVLRGSISLLWVASLGLFFACLDFGPFSLFLFRSHSHS